MGDNTTSQAISPGRRAAAYWFIDGLPEIAFGLAYLLWGGLGIAWGFHWPNPWYKAATVIAGSAFFTLFCADRKVLDFLKARLTYPRTGYVRPPAQASFERPEEPITLRAARRFDENVSAFRIRGIYFFFIAMTMVGLTDGAHWTVAVLMLAVAVLEYAANRTEPHAYSWWAVLFIALLGLLSEFVDIPRRSREYMPLVIGGIWLLAQGAWTLIRYLRAHPHVQPLEGAGV